MIFSARGTEANSRLRNCRGQSFSLRTSPSTCTLKGLSELTANFGACRLTASFLSA